MIFTMLQIYHIVRDQICRVVLLDFLMKEKKIQRETNNHTVSKKTQSLVFINRLSEGSEKVLLLGIFISFKNSEL